MSYTDESGTMFVMPEILVKCEGCGKIADYHEILDVNSPYDPSLMLCEKCAKLHQSPSSIKGDEK